MPFEPPSRPEPSLLRLALQRSCGALAVDLARLWPLFLLEMLTLYLPPSLNGAVDVKAQCVLALRAYVEDMAAFSDEAVMEGWREVRRGYEGLRWPPPELLAEACRRAERKAARPPSDVDMARLPFWKREAARVLEPHLFRTWIAPLELVAIDEGLAVLSAPSRLHADRALGHYRALLLRQLGREYPDVDGIEMTVMAAGPAHDAGRRVFA